MSLSETLIILLVSLLVFGPKQLPMLGHHLGRLFNKLSRWKSQYHQLLDNEMKKQQLEENIKKAIEAESKQ